MSLALNELRFWQRSFKFTFRGCGVGPLTFVRVAWLGVFAAARRWMIYKLNARPLAILALVGCHLNMATPSKLLNLAGTFGAAVTLHRGQP